MEVKCVQRFFKRWAEIQIKYRFPFLFFIAIISIIGMTGIRKVQILSDQNDMIPKTEEHKLMMKEFENLFGNSENIVLLVEANDVFQSEVLKTIKAIGAELLEKVPYSSSVMSITDVEITIGNDDGMEVYRPFENGIPEEKEEIEKEKHIILSRKSLVNKLVSSDSKECWIILSLNPFPEDDEKEGNALTAPMYKAGQAAIDVVTDPKWLSDSYTIKAAGVPYTEMEEHTVVLEETTKTVIVSFSIMILLLIVFTMSFVGTIIPVIALVLGIGVVFGFMGHFNIVADSYMVSIPVLLAMALSVGYSIHLLNSFKHYFYKIGKRKEAVIASIEETGWPLLFTVITTIASVLSFLTTSLYPLRWLGASCAATVWSVYFYTAMIIPIVMSFGKDKEVNQLSKKREAKLFNFVDEQFVHFGGFVVKHRVSIIVVSCLIFIACLPGLFNMAIKMDGYTFMGFRIPYIKRLDSIVNSKLGSYFNYNVMIRFDEEDALKNVENLKKIEMLEEFIASFEHTKKVEGEPKIFSILNVVKEMNQTLNEDKVSLYKLPYSDKELTEMLFLYEVSGGDILKWIDDEYKTARMRVEVKEFDSEEITRNMKILEGRAKEIIPNAKIFLIGNELEFANINSYIVWGEISSLIFSLLAIFILMLLAFGSVKLALIGMIPNIAPLFAIGAIMSYFGIYLDMITMTIMPMLLGISVDDTIYFITHSKLEFESTHDYKASVICTFKTIGKTLLATSVILCIGFATNAVSLLQGIVQIGLLGAFGFFVALVADYFITPVLIFMLKPFRK